MVSQNCVKLQKYKDISLLFWLVFQTWKSFEIRHVNLAIKWMHVDIIKNLWLPECVPDFKSLMRKVSPMASKILFFSSVVISELFVVLATCWRDTIQLYDIIQITESLLNSQYA